jgi:hypothetical protein
MLPGPQYFHQHILMFLLNEIIFLNSYQILQNLFQAFFCDGLALKEGGLQLSIHASMHQMGSFAIRDPNPGNE